VFEACAWLLHKIWIALDASATSSATERSGESALRPMPHVPWTRLGEKHDHAGGGKAINASKAAWRAFSSWARGGRVRSGGKGGVLGGIEAATDGAFTIPEITRLGARPVPAEILGGVRGTWRWCQGESGEGPRWEYTP